MEGTRIGLALVHELARLHGGEVQVESLEGEGSTFFVALPLGRAHLPEDRVSTVPVMRANALAAEHFVTEAERWTPKELPITAPTVPARARVLIADDNADMRAYATRLLTDAGYAVEAVDDGEAALAMARAHPPELLLSDVMMPRLDGFGLMAAVRADEVLRTLPVVLLSARAGDEARLEGLPPARTIIW